MVSFICQKEWYRDNAANHLMHFVSGDRSVGGMCADNIIGRAIPNGIGSHTITTTNNRIRDRNTLASS